MQSITKESARHFIKASPMMCNGKASVKIVGSGYSQLWYDGQLIAARNNRILVWFGGLGDYQGKAASMIVDMMNDLFTILKKKRYKVHYNRAKITSEGIIVHRTKDGKRVNLTTVANKLMATKKMNFIFR